MLAPPLAGQEAEFVPEFGQRMLLTIDTEEEFDWNAPFSATDHGLKHVPAIERFQLYCEGLGVSPLYLVDWPIVQDDAAAELLGDAVKRGKAEVGIQLHPWVNPPHDEEVNTRNSFAGNLPQALEKSKFKSLRAAIVERFDIEPMVYRAGRYGLGPDTAELLIENGIAVDTSVRANYDYSDRHGADYSRHPLKPYWVDSEKRLLELPVTTVFFGMLRHQGRLISPLTQRIPALGGVLTRLGMLEKIPLTPEGVTIEEALRGADIAIDEGLPVINLSLHSPSLAAGFTPYVRDQAGVERLYEWIATVHAYLAQHGVRPTNLAEIMRSAVR
ncbi:MAG: polysaccharide deacetylase family protein [Erythrobacter sp.]